MNLQALAGLVVVSLAVLLPGQPTALLGAELIASLVVYAWLLVAGAIHTSREMHGLPRWVVTRLLRQLPAGISLLVGSGPGLFLEVPVILVALPVTILNTWRVLIVPEGV